MGGIRVGAAAERRRPSERPTPRERAHAYVDRLQGMLLSQPGPGLVLDTDLRIVDANQAYQDATMSCLEDLRGRPMFDAFPDNPNCDGADGVRNLGISLRKVLHECEPHQMAIQRYDMPDRVANDGGWLMRVWSPANYPVFASDSRELTHVMHYVIDVTEAVLLRQWIDEQEIVLAEQLATLDAQRRELLGRRRAMQEAASPLAAMLSTPTAQGNVDGLRRRLGAPHVPDYVLAGGRAEHRGIYMAYHRHDGESIARRVFFDIGWPIPGCHRCGNGLRYRLISGL